MLKSSSNLRACKFSAVRYITLTELEQAESGFTTPGSLERVEVHAKGYFHCWGSRLDADSNNHAETVGIVEDLHGQVYTTDPSNITFTNDAEVEAEKLKQKANGDQMQLKDVITLQGNLVKLAQVVDVPITVYNSIIQCTAEAYAAIRRELLKK